MQCPVRNCDACPWLKSSPAGQFTVERYISLAETSLQGWGSIFACHKTPEGHDRPCAGWLKVDAEENLNVRLQRAMGTLPRAEEIEATGPLYESYGAMAEANGLSAEMVDSLQVRSNRRTRAGDGPRHPKQE